MNCDELEQLIINLENNLTERLTNIEYSSQKIFNVLGGDNWQFTNPNDPNLPTWLINPEATIKQNGTNLYAQTGGDTLTAENIFELITGLMAVNYFRQGHHRLPATVLTSLVNTEEGNQPLTIEDSLSFSEWIIRQIDAVVGEFPLNIKYQGQNSEGEQTEQIIPIQNLSEGIAEILGLSLGIGSDSDTLINIGMKTLVEARSAANAAIVATDYAAANAQYLGYKGNQVERKIPLTFTPGAANLTDTLKPSEKSIISWENEDKETLVELIKRTLVGAEIIKAGLFHPWQPGQPITGDKIKEDREAAQQQNEEKWEQFKQRINNPSGRYDLNKPKAQIKDLTVDTPEA